jgi:signal transduction histidine kinase
MHQVFYNLINNALKFSRADVRPTITLSSSIEENASGEAYHHIIVEDNGIGFNPAFNDKMFGVFFRLNAKDKFEGTGLGLALCRKIVNRHRGRIYAEGEEGRGAKFHIELPVETKKI